MNSTTTARFRDALAALPTDVQQRAREAYEQFASDPSHPGLRFKKVHDPNVYSVRVTRDYRALGVLDGDTVVWFWIGSHSEYDELLDRM